MNYPHPNVMEALGAVIEAEAFALCEESGRVVLILPGSKGFEVTGEEVDELLARRWIEEADDTIRVTEAGVYWNRRYRNQPRK